MNIYGDVYAEVKFKEAPAAGVPTGQLTVDVNYSQHFDNGVSANQADLIYETTGTIAASGTANIDLAGVVTNDFGAILTFVTVKAICLQAAAANTNDVVIGAGTNPFIGPWGGTTPTSAVRPGGVILLCSPKVGWTVTPATGDILKLANSGAGTSVSYTLAIVGTSA